MIYCPKKTEKIQPARQLQTKRGTANLQCPFFVCLDCVRINQGKKLVTEIVVGPREVQLDQLFVTIHAVILG